MEWAIVFYAIFMTSDGIKEDISWGLTFFHHEQCEQFFNANKLDIVRGLAEYSTKTYEQPILKPTSSMSFSHYAQAPNNIQEQVIEAAKG